MPNMKVHGLYLYEYWRQRNQEYSTNTTSRMPNSKVHVLYLNEYWSDKEKQTHRMLSISNTCRVSWPLDASNGDLCEHRINHIKNVVAGYGLYVPTPSAGHLRSMGKTPTEDQLKISMDCRLRTTERSHRL